MKVLVAPSILAADFSKLDREIAKVQEAGADLIHIDVMDGHFVPNITIGPDQITWIKKASFLPLDVHLMIKNPFNLLDAFVQAGSDIITVHIETIDLNQLRSRFLELKKKKVRLGIALNPDTPVERIGSVAEYLDFILLMSVNPGFCGQKFMPIVYPKIEALRKFFKFDIEIDGGVNNTNSQRLISCGANVLAAGSFIFKAEDVSGAIRSLRG